MSIVAVSNAPECRAGPLAGMRVVEMAAIGPVPFCGMVLADMGAELIRIDRIGGSDLGLPTDARFDCLGRGKRSIALDLKNPDGLAVVRRLAENAEALIEGFRPGTMERLGLGPEACLATNPRLVYGRCSGWGEAGPMAASAGHDINFLAMSGALAAMGVQGPPAPPLNLVGDFGGAALHLACGVLAGVIAARGTGQGQVVATSIAHGSLALMPMIYGLHAAGQWSLERGQNPLDGGAPYYRCYETSDAKYMAVGAIEAKFYAALLAKLGLQGRVDPAAQNDRALWPATASLFDARFRERSGREWSDIFAGSDACVTPVLDMAEAPHHPQNQAARGFIELDGVTQPAPTPGFSKSAPAAPVAPPKLGADSSLVLRQIGYGESEIAKLIADGVVADRAGQ